MNTSEPELHLFLIWSNARPLQEKVIDDIKVAFDIVRVFEISWSEAAFSSNLTRFYGQNLPDRSFKEQHCGKGPFIVIVVRDNKPCYEMRETSHGPSRVNVSMFDKKQLYRNWTGGGHRIHATDTPVETDHNLTLLTGICANDFCKAYPQSFDGTIEPLQRDLPGVNGWESIEQLFYVLNHTVMYVVLRNFEGLPAQYTLKSHGDIDLLADSVLSLKYILNAKPVFPNTPRILHYTMVNREKVLFDFRSVGDNYYDTTWENALLTNRIFDVNGFYRPAADDYFYSLLYHALIHKPAVSDDYKVRLSDRAQDVGVALNPEDFDRREYCISILNGYMSSNRYQYTEPADTSVYFNYVSTPVKKISIARIFSSSKTIGNAIGRIIAQTTDRTSDSIELQTPEVVANRVLRSHFSRERVFPVSLVKVNKKMRVVEFGAQTGVITRYLGERCGMVYAVEPQADLADAARLRCADLDNVEIVSAPAYDDRHIDKYDLAVLLTEWPKGQPDHLAQIMIRKWLETASQFLVAEGTLIFAVDNKESIMSSMFGQVAAGLSKSEIDQFLLYAGFNSKCFHYAFPGHQFPQNVFSDDSCKLDSTIMGHWASSTVFTDKNNREFRSPLIADLFTKLHAGGQFGEKAPSFIVVAGKTTVEKPNWLVKKWAGFPRQICMQAETELVHTGGALMVRKMGRACEDSLFSFTPDITVPLYAGVTLESKLSSSIATGDTSGYLSLFAEYIAFVKKEFAIKGDVPMELSGDDCMVGGEALDGNFSNIIITQEGWRFFDLEWRCRYPMPLSLVLFRSISVHLQSVDKPKLTALLSRRPDESLVTIMQLVTRQLNLPAISEGRSITNYIDFQDRFYAFVFNRQRKKPAFLELYLPMCHSDDESLREELHRTLQKEYPSAPELEQIRKPSGSGT